MTRNILLTSLDAPGSDQALRYYAVRNEYGYDYCEALQSMEASAKYILARFPIDEIIVIGDADDAEKLEPRPLKDAGDLDAAGPGTLSPFDLYRSRMAQYIGEVSLEQQAYDALLPEAERAKLIDFIRDFQEKNSQRDMKRLNRLFDELSSDKPLYQRFKDALSAAFPKAGNDFETTVKWVKNYLYAQLKPSAKLEILPVNEGICARYLPSGTLDDREYWMSSVLDVDQDANEDDEIDLYVSLGAESAVESHLVLNILDILIATPGSHVHLKKIYQVYEAAGDLTGTIVDSTIVTRSTDLVAAAHAFLNYAKTDMLVDFWERSGQHNERVSSLIYAARHVDVGISMCNILEVQEGIQRLRRLLTDERSWKEAGDYGPLFGVIAGCIQADYGPLLDEDGSIPFIRLIKWAYKHQLYQQVLTLIETYAPSNMVEAGIFYYCDDEARAAEITDLLALQRLELKPYEYYKMDDISHYFVKSYDRGDVKLNGSRGEDRNMAYAALRAQSVENQDPAKITGHTACGADTLTDVLYAYYHLGEVRNKISHADANAMAERRLNVAESDVSYGMVVMRETIEYFIRSYEAAMAEAKAKDPKIVYITADDVRNAADRIRRERPKEDRRH